MPYVVTDSKSPERTTVITLGNANTRRPDTVVPEASCALAGSNRTRSTARPATRTGSPEPSASSVST
jgi:hypothetical protein